MLPASWGRGAKANVLLLAQASALLSVPFPKEFRTDTSKKDKPESQYLSFYLPVAQHNTKCVYFSVLTFLNHLDVFLCQHHIRCYLNSYLVPYNMQFM